jgi:hypothetical protein
MGITVSPATAASGGGGGTSLPVVPGTSVEQEIYTDVGFSTGDYVYRYGRGNVGALSFPISYPLSNTSTIVGGSAKTISSVTGSLTKASFISPNGAPFPSTYSGASLTLGAASLAQTVLQATSIAGVPDACLLSNGNIVSIFTLTSPVTTLNFQISTPAGAAVASGTVTTTMRNSTAYSTPYSVCALNGGGFAVAYEHSSTGFAHTVVYTNAGVVSRADANSSNSIGAYYPFIAVNSSDTIYLSFTQNPNNSGNGYITYLNAAGATAITPFIITGSYYPTGKMSIAVAPNGNVGFCYADLGNATGATNSFAVVYNSTLTSQISSTVNSYYFANNPTAIALPNNGFLMCFGASSGVGAVYYNPTANSWSASALLNTLANNINRCIPYSGNIAGSTLSTDNLGAIVIGVIGGVCHAGVINVTPGGSFSSSTFLTSMGNPSANGPAYFLLPGGVFANVYRSTTPNLALRTFNSLTVASGSGFSISQSTYFSPANNYALLGVATTTAAAGATGTIIINGQVPLSASYGTSSTPVWFDYNPLNKVNNVGGNHGYVVNRMVVLKGLEQ